MNYGTDELLKILLDKQLPKVALDKKLRYLDLKRISTYINTNPFDENHCCLWNGYVTNTNNIDKGVYVNFYFKGKKVALHRLMYLNFIGPLNENEYLKYTCDNKGQCCNVMHLKRFRYVKATTNEKTTMVHKKDMKPTLPQASDPFRLSFG